MHSYGTMVQGCIYVYSEVCLCNLLILHWLRMWAGYLNQPISKASRKKLKEKAQSMGKEIVKVTINKTTGKKVVMGA